MLSSTRCSSSSNSSTPDARALARDCNSSRLSLSLQCLLANDRPKQTLQESVIRFLEGKVTISSLAWPPFRSCTIMADTTAQQAAPAPGSDAITTPKLPELQALKEDDEFEEFAAEGTSPRFRAATWYNGRS